VVPIRHAEPSVTRVVARQSILQVKASFNKLHDSPRGSAPGTVLPPLRGCSKSHKTNLLSRTLSKPWSISC